MSTKPEWDLTHEDLSGKFDVGMGDPTSPLYGQVLSAEDEKSVDEKGNPIIKGKPWSEVSTGCYLVVCLHSKTAAAPVGGKTLGASDIKLDEALRETYGSNWTLSILSTRGIPTFVHPCIGACLEIPADLGEDQLKRQYVVEWLVHTCDESLRKVGLGVLPNAKKHAAAAVADAANHVISKVL